MRKIRVYVDTSVFGGTQEQKFKESSLRFFEKVAAGKYLVLLSTETLRELRGAPQPVQNVWLNLDPDSYEILLTNPEIQELATLYLDAGVLTPSSSSDALHVAAATVASADLIISWNFKHIVNFKRTSGFNSVNIRLGYRPMTIMSPDGVKEDEGE